MVVLKKLFHSWTEKIHAHHRRRLSLAQREETAPSRLSDLEGAQLPQNMPEAKLSNAAQGNYLEVLNICLNLYDKSHINRIFDHTGNSLTRRDLDEIFIFAHKNLLGGEQI